MADSIDWEKGAMSPPASEPGAVDWEKGEIAPPIEAKGLGGHLKDAGLALAKGVIAVPEAAVGLADLASNGQVGKFLENKDGAIGFRPKEAREYLGEFATEASKDQQRQFQQADGLVDKAGVALSNPSLISNAVVESLPSMGLGGALGRGVMAAVPRLGAVGAGAIGEGVVGAGSSAEQTRQQTEDGLLTGKQAGLAAASGAATAGFGALGGKVAQRLGIGEVDSMLVQGSTKAAGAPSAKGVSRQVIEGAISEGLLEELPQSVSETVLQNLALNKPWSEGVDEAIVMGALTGMAMGGAAAGASGFSAQGAQGEMPPALDPAPSEPAAPADMLALPAPTITVGPDGTAATAAQRQAQRDAAEDVPFIDVPSTPPAAKAFPGILDTDEVYSGWSNVQDGTDRSKMREQMDYVAWFYGGKVTADNRDAVQQELTQQFKWFRAATPEQRSLAVNSLVAPANPVKASEAMGLDPNAGPLSTAAAMAVDGGASQQVQVQQEQASAQSAGLEVDQSTGEIVDSPVIPMAERDEKELRKQFQAAQSPSVRRVIADELARRRVDAVAEEEKPNLKSALKKIQAKKAAAGTAQTVAVGATTKGENGKAAKEPQATSTQATAPARVDGGIAPTGKPIARPVAVEAPGVAQPDIKTVVAKQIPDMSDVELGQAIAHYGPGHKRTAKLQAALDKRASVKMTPPATLTKDVVAEAAHEAATSPKNDLPVPTDAQKEAGNYKKGHVSVNGHDISIENPAGTKRRPEWPALKNHYGYFKGTVGADKDHVDVFLTDRASDASLPVFVVDQRNKDGSFDEHKVVMGTADEAEARATYLANYSKGWTGLGAITQMSQDEFSAWVRDSGKTKRPAAPTTSPKGNTDGTQADQTQQAATQREEAAGAPAAGALTVKADAPPGMRQNTEADKAGANRLERLLEVFTAERSTPGGSARSIIRSVIDELRKPRTASSVEALLQTASDRLRGKHGAQADVVDEVLESIQQKDIHTKDGQNSGATSEAGAQWTRMTTPERQAMVARIVASPITKANLHKVAWEKINPKIQQKLADALAPTPAAKPADMAGFTNAAESDMDLRRLAHAVEAPGDVLLGNDKFVTLDQAVAAAKKHMEPQSWSMPFQFMRVLDVAPRDWNRMVQAMKDDAPAGQNDELDAEMRSYEAKATRPKPKEESQQDKSEREWRENYDRVANTDDLTAVSTKDLERAQAWASRKSASEKRKGWDGGAVNQNLVSSIDGEISRIADEVARRRVAAEKPADTTKPDIFANNKLFTSDKVAAARERMKKKLGTLNSGIDPEMMSDGIFVAAAYIEAGVRSFADFANSMVSDLGEGVKPYLLSAWEGARHYPGLDTKGMTSATQSAQLHAAMMTPEVKEQAAEAVGTVAPAPAKRTKKTGKSGDMTLTQDWGVEHINGYGDSTREEGNETKDAFLKETRDYLRQVSLVLQDSGFVAHADMNGKSSKIVSVNESGSAGSGDVSLTMHHPDTGTNVYVTIGDTAIRGMVPSTPSGIAIMYRVATGSDRFAAKGGNTWAPVDLSASDLALLVSRSARSTIDKRTHTTVATDTNHATDSGQSGHSAGQGRAPEVSGSRGSDNATAERADPGNVEAGQPSDVPAPADAGRAGGDGVRVPSSDVGGKRSAGKVGDAANGRAGAGRARAPDAGAGNRANVKAPEEVSPANAGPGNFHIENPLEIVGGGQVARFGKNQAAIDLLGVIREESRQATAEEQRTLAGYTGWGSFGQELFQGTWEKPMPKEGWQARDKWLREHLGEDEWKSAQRSITNAHYTDPPTVTAMWDMVKRMGFTGGRVLEPSMGIGNFFGMMPADIKARSQLSGIELDSLTGAMAKLLYPNANVKIMGYQESKTPDDFHDVVIGNWPFENTTIADRRYNSLSPFLHDYFFLKAVDQVRPGGLVIGITSNGTMDKKATRIRAALAKKAELVTAIRLPSGAFQEYAGTKVVTDIVILRKREQPLSQVPADPWINSVAYKTPAGPEVFINEYYVANPGNVIGTTDFGHGTTRMQPGMIVHRPENMAERLKAAVELVPEGAYQKAVRAKHITYITNHTADREGALTEQDGQLMVVRGEHLAPAEEVRSYKLKSASATAQREKELRDLIGMRGKYAALIEADRGGADATAQRTALREAYEAFTAEHGPLGDSFGLNYLKRIDDPFRPALAALDVNGRPSAILTGSTMRGATVLKNPSAQDAYVLARNSAVEPSIEEIAVLANKPADEVKAALLKSGAIFETPSGAIAPSDIYLSGNVREKLRQAQAALEDGNTAMQRNVDELSKVVPKDIPYFNIESQLGATWVPPKTYAAYVAHMLNLPDGDAIGVTFINGRWKVKTPEGSNNRAEAQTGFGTGHYPFSKLVNAAMSNQTVKIRYKDSDGVEHVDIEATDEANGKISDIRGKFGEWLWSDPERRVAQEREYNEVRNAYATPKYDGSFLSFEGMALSLGRGPFNLREHQVNAIWRALVNRRSLNGHEVGTGKTFTMGGIAVESRRYGIAKKPMLLAHNANSASVASEIQQMYPGAKVLYIDNLTPDTIAVKMRQIANDDWDVIVLPHSLIDRLSFREETLMAMAKEDIRSLEEEAYAAAEDDGVTITAEMLEDDDELKKLRSVTAKELVKARNRIIESIKEQAMRSSKEGAIPFEELGIDMVLVDEVHEFKKPPISTRMNMKGLNTQTSNRSIALQFITRYIRANNNGGNVHTFTGTPITNTLTEIFHQMRYVMEDEMKAAGVETWDGWFGSFAKEVQDVELSAAGEYEAVTRLAGFINVPELRRMIGQYMDVVFADDMPEMQPRKVNGKTMASANLTESERAELLNGRTEGAGDRPYKKVINVTSDLTPEQKTIFAQLQGYARSWRSMGGKARKEAMATGAPESPIITEGMANKASFDVRLTRDSQFAGQEGTAPDDAGSKASKLVANVLEVYRSSADAAQVIFAEQGYSTSQKRSAGRDAAGKKQYRTVKTFSTMRDIVERLVDQGIPREQIAMVDGSTSKEKRKEIADAMNTLAVRVVIGSTDTLGVGVNMQRNLRAMHHMDAPYMPGELEQRNGRGLRQGNQWNTVLEYRYMTDRLDGRRWQILAIKQRFITAFLKANSDTRVIEGDAAADEDNDILQSFSEAAGDPRILIREKLNKNVEALKRAERLHTNGIADARQTARRTTDGIAWAKKRLAEMTANDLPGVVRRLLQSQSANYQATVDGTTYDSRAEAEDAMQKSLQDNVRMGNTSVPMGTYGGQPVMASWESLQNAPTLTITMGNQEFASSSLRGLESQLRGLPARIEKVEQEIAAKSASIARMEEVAAAPFARAADLDRAKKQFDALVADIAANPVPPPAWLRAGAPVESAAFRGGKEFLVTGHRWNAEGWFVLAQDAKGEVAIPFADVTDSQGMALYEPREFEAPEVHTKETKTAVAADEKAADDAAMSLTGNASTGMPLAAGQALAKQFSDLGLNKINVARSLADLPDDQRQRLEARNATGVRGVYFPKEDQVWVVLDNVSTPEEFTFVAVHEAFHRGLRAIFGKEALPIMRQMYLSNPKLRARADALAKTLEVGRDEAIEEALADMAAEGSLDELKGWKRLLAMIKDWANALAKAVGADITFTDEMVETFVAGVSKAGLRTDPAGAVHVLADAPAEALDDSPMMSRAAVLGKATDALNQTFSHPGKLNWWHKTVGSMYNLAERSPEFKRVFKSAQGFIDDVSFYANESSNLAPKILPKLDELKDLTKSAISFADNRAISAPIFEGTLSWGRDESGKAVLVDDLRKVAANLTIDQKADRLVRSGQLPAGAVAMWRGLPVDQFEANIESSYERRFLKPGVVWSDAELKDIFKLNPEQIGLYREFRRAADRSLDDAAKAEMLRYGGKDVAGLKDRVMRASSLEKAAMLLQDHLLKEGDNNPARAKELADTINGVIKRADKIAKLKDEGYAPLSRFGQYSVDVVADGERKYFGLFETQRDANRMARSMEAEFGKANVSQGTMSQRAFELFQGITPESLELFGNMLGLESTGNEVQDQVFQQYLKLTKNNTSAMKRLIHRKGVMGYSEDVGRVLASFVYSNARQASAALHMGDLGEAVAAIPKDMGELKDAAVGLTDYIKKPREEAQVLRGFLFAQYLGGSVASAFVNLTQPIAVSFPYLSQFGGARQAGAELARAMKDMAKLGGKYESGLRQALRVAEEQGVVSPQEVHQLMAQARGAATLTSGDGTKLGDSLAFGRNQLTRMSVAWGKLFGYAEQINRRSTFIAAYRIAVAQKLADPAAFATKAVNETQFINNRGNKMQWGRGAVGATLMTFKSYSFNYLELLHRMATRNGPEGKKAAALMLGMLMLTAGAGGLPFEEDLEDLVDFFAQRMGYNFSSAAARREFLEDTFGRTGANFIERGVTGLPGSPLDVSGRLGMGNIIPATGLLLKKTDHTRDVQELIGPAGDFVSRVLKAGDHLASGNVAQAALSIAPKAASNLAKGADMLNEGAYRDDKGYKVLDTTTLEGAMKALGFQPATVSKTQEANYQNQRAKDFYNQHAQDIRARWAKGIAEKDMDQINAARDMLAKWNEQNPEQRISANLPSILKKAREMLKPKEQRIAETAPKAMRAKLMRDIAESRQE